MKTRKIAELGFVSCRWPAARLASPLWRVAGCGCVCRVEGLTHLKHGTRMELAQERFHLVYFAAAFLFRDPQRRADAVGQCGTAGDGV